MTREFVPPLRMTVNKEDGVVPYFDTKVQLRYINSGFWTQENIQ